jgi:hypothetical protein
MGFRLAFGRTRYRYTYYGSGFEGWISELRLANRTMLGGEAYALMSNASAWTSSYAMNGCSVKENPLRFSSSVTLPTCPSMSTCHQDHFAVETPSAAISLHRITSRRSVAAAFSGFARQRTSGASAARRPGAWNVAPIAHAAASASIARTAHVFANATLTTTTPTSHASRTDTTNEESSRSMSSSSTTSVPMSATPRTAGTMPTTTTLFAEVANVSAFSTSVWIVIVVVVAVICLGIGMLVACVKYWRARGTNQEESAPNNVAVNENIKDDEDMSSAIYGICLLLFNINLRPQQLFLFFCR